MNAEKYPLLPLRDMIIYPDITKSVVVGRDRSKKAVEVANDSDKKIFLIVQRDEKIENISQDNLYDIGVVAEIRQFSKLPDNTIKVLLAGLYIAKMSTCEEQDGAYYANVEKVEFEELTSTDESKYRQLLDKTLDEYAKATSKISTELLSVIQGSIDAKSLIFIIADGLSVRLVEKQRLIEQPTYVEQIELIVEFMHTELEIILLDERIKQRVKHQMSKSNREYHLNEQMKAIQQEMGKDDDFKEDLDELEEKLEEATMPEDVRKRAERELRKLKIMAPMSAESTVVRNYLEWLVSLPWGKATQDHLDVVTAENILNKDHFGLEKPKERILEYLAVRKLANNLKGPIICFIGPPGVGKTSLARSIATAMKRNFIRMSMGGVRDEAEIRGHRKTYIGSMPGKIIQSLRKAGSENPVFLLDEIDKLGSDYRGDPSAALLEALDPEQNKHFVDHYLEVEFDLSKVFFITTANSTENIPSALLDRMELISISGYTELEKYQIARKYLVPKQLTEHNLDEARVSIEDDAIYEVIRYYTKEAGVRNLERQIAALVRKSARKIVKDEKLESVTVVQKDIETMLGNRIYRMSTVYDDLEIGVATGLAWTPYGGDLLQIEVALSKGTGKLELTGKLGDVMKESAKTALSLVKTKANSFGITPERFTEVDIHIHVPEGAVPKDGPSAGVTMTTALMSAMSNMYSKCNIAMTGEVTLRGKVLAVGGIKEKVLAAHRAGIKEIFLPLDNEKDLTDVPEDVRNGIKFHLISNVDELFDRNIITKVG